MPDTRYHGIVVDVEIEEVDLPNGSRLTMEIVRHPGGAAVVALNDKGRVCLLRQYRHVVGDWLWELPAGKIDHREPPDETARRELAEEAGVTASEWRPLGRIVSSPGVFDETIHLYLASHLTPVDVPHEDHEVFEVHWIPLEEAVASIHQGRIIDAKTIAGLVRAAAELRKG